MGAYKFFAMAIALAAALSIASSARAQEQTTDDAECKPTCRLGFECTKGECVAEQCKPGCRSGFTCIEGECKSACNPPCGSNERCTEKAECVRLAPVHVAEHDDESSTTRAQPNPTDRVSPPQRYVPSVSRLYVGPMMFSASVDGGPFFTDPGGSVAADFHLDAERVVFLGFRFSAWGDSTGVAALFDVDVGLRPRLWTGTDDAVSLVIGGALGVAYFGSTPHIVGFHMPLRVGPCFDFGTFTFEVLGGPVLYAARSALGAFEGIAEVGARF